MSAFDNSRPFRTCIRLPFVKANGGCTVKIRAAGHKHGVMGITGRLDTGVTRTCLKFETARELGIDRPESVPAERWKTSTDQEMDVYLHRIIIIVDDSIGNCPAPIHFPLRAGFALEVKRNLFGLDWLQFMCLAFDLDAAYCLVD